MENLEKYIAEHLSQWRNKTCHIPEIPEFPEFSFTINIPCCEINLPPIMFYQPNDLA